jgi:hypothetical protein
MLRARASAGRSAPMKSNRILLVAIPTLLVSLGACAAETETDDADGAEPNDVRVGVDGDATHVEPKMTWWCEPHTSDTIDDCRSGTCQPAEITCDECSWLSLTFRGGCYYSE